jgi:hypothetical protein
MVGAIFNIKKPDRFVCFNGSGIQMLTLVRKQINFSDHKPSRNWTEFFILKAFGKVMWVDSGI